VIYHDECINLPCGKLDIASMDLKQFRFFNQKFPKDQIVIEDIPATLPDILAAIHQERGINIELKMYHSTCLESSLQEFYNYCIGIYNQVISSKTLSVVFSSFNYVLCLMIKAIQTKFPVFFILPPEEMDLSNLDKSLEEELFDGIVMSAPQALLFGENLIKVKQKYQLKYFTYSQLENPDALRDQVAIGIDGFIIDDPKRYTSLLSN
jgi:glycerophosphoryl diester phosphodiesterase